MLTALVLLLVMAGIVVTSRRWPDVETRLWPGQGVIPKDQTAEPEEPHHRPAHHVHHHRAAHPAAKHEPKHEVKHEPPAPKPSPPKPKPEPEPKPEPKPELKSEPKRPSARPTAGGVMRTKPIASEPDVSPTVLESQPTEPAPSPPPVKEPKPAEAPVAPSSPPPPSPPPAKPAAAEEEAPAPATPGERVTGTPARPSQPAYYNATSGVTENIDDLATEADQAYRDRDYERAEQACLKILVQQPKNHKYMTRIGQIYQEMGQLQDAKEAFEAAKKLDPKNFFVLNRLTEVERMLKDKGGRTKGKSKK